MKHVMMVLALVLASVNAEAKSINFSFDVFSSGNDIYVCNAGLAQAATGGTCHIDGNPQNASCNPSSCVANQPCNCVCTGSDGGAWLANFMTATTRPYGSTAAATPATKGSWDNLYNPVQFFDDNNPGATTNSWDNVFESLSFNFGSETYGAQYFVDICYRGPQVDYYKNNIFSQSALTSSVTVTDLNLTNSNLSYASLAGLTVTTTVSCDLQGMGNNMYAANSSGAYDTDVNDTNITKLSAGDFGLTSAVATLSSGSTATTFNERFINNANGIAAADAPRFCKVRYTFQETNTGAFRKWQLQDAQVCTYTAIEEGLSSGQNNLN